MPRQRMLFALIIFAALLAACSAAVQAPTPAPSTSLGTGPTAVSVSVSPYDGSWEGGGTAQDGREITIRITVQGGAIASFTYSYLRPATLPSCGRDERISTAATPLCRPRGRRRNKRSRKQSRPRL